MGRGNAVAPPYQYRSLKHVGSMFLGCSLLVSSLPPPSACARWQCRHPASWQPAATLYSIPTPEGLSRLRGLPNSSTERWRLALSKPREAFGVRAACCRCRTPRPKAPASWAHSTRFAKSLTYKRPHGQCRGECQGLGPTPVRPVLPAGGQNGDLRSLKPFWGEPYTQT